MPNYLGDTAVTGQIQVRKYAEAANTITGDQAGTPLKGAVYEITQADPARSRVTSQRMPMAWQPVTRCLWAGIS